MDSKKMNLAAPAIKVRMFKEFIFSDPHKESIFLGELINFKSEADEPHCYVSVEGSSTDANSITEYCFNFNSEEDAIKNTIFRWNIADFNHTEKDVSYIREYEYDLPKYYGWKPASFADDFTSVNICNFVANAIHVDHTHMDVYDGKYSFTGSICSNRYRNDTIFTFTAIPSINGYSIELCNPYGKYLNDPDLNHILRDTFGTGNTSIVNAIYMVISNHLYYYLQNNSSEVKLLMSIVGDMPFDKAKDYIRRLFDDEKINYFIASIVTAMIE